MLYGEVTLTAKLCTIQFAPSSDRGNSNVADPDMTVYNDMQHVLKIPNSRSSFRAFGSSSHSHVTVRYRPSITVCSTGIALKTWSNLYPERLIFLLFSVHLAAGGGVMRI